MTSAHVVWRWSGLLLFAFAVAGCPDYAHRPSRLPVDGSGVDGGGADG